MRARECFGALISATDLSTRISVKQISVHLLCLRVSAVNKASHPHRDPEAQRCTEFDRKKRIESPGALLYDLLQFQHTGGQRK